MPVSFTADPAVAGRLVVTSIAKRVLPPAEGLILAVTPYAGALLPALARGFPGARLQLVTPHLREAGAAHDACPSEDRARAAIMAGDSLEVACRSGGAAPDLIILWPSGWEGRRWLCGQVELGAAYLPAGGSLCLVTSKQRGAAGLRQDLAQAFGEAEIIARGPHGMRVLRAVRPAGRWPGSPTGRDPTAAQGALVQADLLGRHFVFRTAAGQFSPRALNPGTRLLLECLHQAALHHARTMLDLGCGYGAVGIVLAALYPEATVVLVDVDARAVALAEANAELNGVAARAVACLSDGLRHLPGRSFDVVASHFPLHIPRQEQERLVAEARDALAPGGRIYLAALADYDLRPQVRAVCGDVTTVVEWEMAPGDRYRVIEACPPRPSGDPPGRTPQGGGRSSHGKAERDAQTLQ